MSGIPQELPLGLGLGSGFGLGLGLGLGLGWPFYTGQAAAGWLASPDLPPGAAA